MSVVKNAKKAGKRGLALILSLSVPILIQSRNFSTLILFF